MRTRGWTTGVTMGCVALLLTVFAGAGEFETSVPTVVDRQYQIKVLVPGSHFHGIHGLAFDSKDALYAGSVVGRTLYRLDPASGDVQEFIGPPLGMADDLEFSPTGMLCWTSFLLGKVHCRAPDGQIKPMAEGLPGINSIAFSPEGRLFAAQVFLGDALHEIDLSGGMKTRKIAENLGGFNGFDVGPDGKLYGPLWFKGEVARIDPESGAVEIVAKGFKTPAAANFDSKWNLYVVDAAVGQVVRVDVKSGEKSVIAKTDPAIDNLAMDSRDRIFISNYAHNGIYEVDPKSGKIRTVVEGKLGCAGGVAVTSGKEGDTVYVADLFSFRKVDGKTGQVTTIARNFQEGAHIEYPSNASVRGDSVLLSSRFTGTVQEFDRKTDRLKRSLTGFKAPSHALLMEDGSIVVAEMASGNILRVKGPEGKERAVVAQGLAGPVCMAPAGGSAVYVSELGGTVSRIDLNKGEKKVIASGLRTPQGIDVLKGGKLLVVEAGARQLLQIDLKTGKTAPLVKDLPVGFLAAPGTPPPKIAGVTASPSGAIYLTSDVENALYRLEPRK